MAAKTKTTAPDPTTANGINEEDWQEVLIVSGVTVRAKPEEGETFEGIYIGTVDRSSRFGAVKLHLFSAAGGGDITGFWGSHALDEGMKRCTEGRATRVSGQGAIELDQGRTMRLVRVWQAGLIRTDVPALTEAEKVAEAEGVFEALDIHGNGIQLDPETGEFLSARS